MVKIGIPHFSERINRDFAKTFEFKGDSFPQADVFDEVVAVQPILPDMIAFSSTYTPNTAIWITGIYYNYRGAIGGGGWNANVTGIKKGNAITLLQHDHGGIVISVETFGQQYITFPYPIRLDKGQPVLINSADSFVLVYGYEEN